MEIREITLDDLDSCIDIFMKEWAKPPYDESWTKDTARLRLTEILDGSHGTSLCVVSDDRIVGFAFCRLVTWYDGKHGCIEEMIVEEQSQKRGIGTQLLKAVEANFKKKGVVEIELLSYNKADAFTFFHKNDYHECDWKHLTKANLKNS